MDRKIVALGSCIGIEKSLANKEYVLEYADRENVLNVLKKEGIEAVVIDTDDIVKANVVISDIRYLYPGLWIVSVSEGRDIKQITLTLKAGANHHIVKPITEQNLLLCTEELKPFNIDVTNSKTPINQDAPDNSFKLNPNRLYNDFFITEYGKLEILRAEQYNKKFSIILTHIEEFSNLKKRLEKDELSTFLKKLIKPIMEVVRSCDVIGRVDEKKLIVILPETDYFGAYITIRKMKKAVEDSLKKGEPYSPIIFSNASYPRDGKGYGELLGAAEKRINEQKEGLWLKSGFENKPFWEIISTLISREGSEEKNSAPFDLGKGFDLPIFFLDRLQEMLIQEISRTQNKKAVLYLGVRKITHDMPILKAIDAIGITATKIFVVGEGEEGRWNYANTIPIYLSDQRLLDTFFIFFLAEDFSYAVVCRERWGEQYSCFHTVDPYLIEGLINKFQKDYSLQEQL